MKSFIFDFNGTLFLDSSMHDRAWKLFMARRGISLTSEEFVKYMCGPPNSVILRQFIDADLSDEDILMLSEEKEAIYREIVLSDPSCQSLTPGAPEFLEFLQSKGLPYAIATSSSRENVDFYFDALDIGRWFTYDNVFYAGGKIPGKPDPAIYRLALQKMGFQTVDTTVVEDATPGIESALAAGIKNVIAIDSTISAEVLKSIAGIKAVIHDFYDLRKFI